MHSKILRRMRPFLIQTCGARCLWRWYNIFRRLFSSDAQKAKPHTKPTDDLNSENQKTEFYLITLMFCCPVSTAPMRDNAASSGPQRNGSSDLNQAEKLTEASQFPQTTMTRTLATQLLLPISARRSHVLATVKQLSLLLPASRLHVFLTLPCSVSAMSMCLFLCLCECPRPCQTACVCLDVFCACALAVCVCPCVFGISSAHQKLHSSPICNWEVSKS